MTRSRAHLAVTFFLPDLAGGGGERVVVTLANALADRGHVIDLVVGSVRGPLIDAVASDVRVVDLQVDRTRQAIAPLARFLRHRRPDTLLSTIEHGNVVAGIASRISATPFVPRLSNTHSALRSAASSRHERVVNQLATVVYRRARLVVAPSRSVADDLVEHFGLRRGTVRVVPSPVIGVPVLSAGGRSPGHAWLDPNDPNDPNKPPVVVAVGRFHPQKGLLTLLEAFAAVRRRRAARLLLLGDGPQRDQLERRAVELGIESDVDLPGFFGDPFPAMCAAGVYAMSSSYEGLPGSLVQALACGPPIVATDCPPNREVLAGGRWGQLVPIGDAPAMADAIVHALDAPRPLRPTDAWSAWSVESAVDAYEALLGTAGRLRRSEAA